MQMSASKLDRSGVLVPCPSCGKTNRLRYATLASAARCGACQTQLSAPAEPVEVSDAAGAREGGERGGGPRDHRESRYRRGPGAWRTRPEPHDSDARDLPGRPQ